MKVLVVDDNPLVVWSVVNAQKTLDLKVEGVTSGRDAIRRIDSDGYDLVITDFRMPDVSGIEVAKVIKYKNPGTKVILLTAYAYLDDLKTMASALAINRIIEKPYNIDEILKFVQEIIGNVQKAD